jgi:hypothetical protein
MYDRDLVFRMLGFRAYGLGFKDFRVLNFGFNG